MKFLLAFTMLGPLALQASSPQWFSDYVKSNPGCERELLCVVGEGETLADALADARLEASKFFQTNIKSKSQISTSSEQKGASANLSSFDEWTHKTVSEETTEMISGLEIKRQESIEGHTYVLMSLERAKTAKLLKEKMESLDLENEKAFNLHSRFAYPKILKNLAQIEDMNARYNLVAMMPLALKVKKENVLERMDKLKPLKMALVTKGRKLPSKLSHSLIELLAPLKVVIVSKKAKPSYALRSELLTEEQYFKVEGFKKLGVTLRLELLNAASSEMGKISAMSEQVARTEDQAVLQAIPEIKENVQDNMDQLSTLKMED
ncbi:MAG: hypothetical protein ACXVLQ_02700 [Bacteriovorax sp.]